MVRALLVHRLLIYRLLIYRLLGRRLLIYRLLIYRLLRHRLLIYRLLGCRLLIYRLLGCRLLIYWLLGCRLLICWLLGLGLLVHRLLRCRLLGDRLLLHHRCGSSSLSRLRGRCCRHNGNRLLLYRFGCFHCLHRCAAAGAKLCSFAELCAAILTKCHVTSSFSIKNVMCTKTPHIPKTNMQRFPISPCPSEPSSPPSHFSPGHNPPGHPGDICFFMEIFLLALRMLYDTFIIAFFPACTLPAAGSLWGKQKNPPTRSRWIGRECMLSTRD